MFALYDVTAFTIN